MDRAGELRLHAASGHGDDFGFVDDDVSLAGDWSGGLLGDGKMDQKTLDEGDDGGIGDGDLDYQRIDYAAEADSWQRARSGSALQSAPTQLYHQQQQQQRQAVEDQQKQLMREQQAEDKDKFWKEFQAKLRMQWPGPEGDDGE